MHVSGKQPQSIIIQKSQASTQELRRLTFQIALRAVLETQDMMANTYNVMNDISEEDYISDETYECVNSLIDAMQALSRVMGGIYINAREEYGIVALPTRDLKGV